jgi:hypothetical protein
MATAAYQVGSKPMSVQGKNFTLLDPLEPLHKAMYQAISRAADNDLLVTQQTLCGILGLSYQYGTFTATLNRMIYMESCPTCGARIGHPCTQGDVILPRHPNRAEGILDHVMGIPLHRGLWLRVVATGRCTAQPPSSIPHWRTIADRVPTPAIHQIRQRDMPLAQWIETETRRTNRDYLDFLQELLRRGAQDYRAKQVEQ